MFGKHSFTPLIIFLFPLLLSACRAGDASPEVPSPTVTSPPAPTRTPFPKEESTSTPEILHGTISIWHAWDDTAIEVLAQLIAEFSSQYPEVYFDVTYVPLDDLLPRYQEAARNGGGPALVFGPSKWGPELDQQGLVATLDEMVPENLLAVLNSAALEAARSSDGALLSLPYSIEGVVLYRNTDLIPSAPATFDDLGRLAEGATRDEVFGAVLERSFFFSGAHLEGLGGHLMHPDGTPAFNDAAGIAWLQLLSSFEDLGSTDFNNDLDLNLFLEGRAGFIIEGTWRMGVLTDAFPAGNLAIDPWPTVQGGSLSGYVRSENIFFNPNPQAGPQKAVWAFIEYFLSPSVQSQLIDAGFMPASMTVLSEDRLVTEAVTALAGGSPYPTHPYIDTYLTPLDMALRMYLQEGRPAEEALAEAEAAVLQALKDQAGTPTSTP